MLVIPAGAGMMGWESPDNRDARPSIDLTGFALQNQIRYGRDWYMVANWPSLLSRLR